MPWIGRRLGRRLPLRAAAAVAVVAVVAAGLVLVGGLGGESLATVQRRVSSEWRPVYDLLVLPPGADVAETVGGQEVTQANFMAALDGGISRQQWQTILEVPGVEVAAPIATLGYFRQTGYAATFAELPAGIYQVGRSVTWDSGLGARVQARTTGDEVADEVSCRRDTPLVLYDGLDGPAEYRRAYQDALVTGFAFDAVGAWQDNGATWDCLGLDPGGVFTVYGIDPEQESRLVGLGNSITEGEPLNPDAGLRTGSPAEFCSSQVEVVDAELERACEPVHRLPLLVNTQEWTDTAFSYEITRLDVPTPAPGQFAAKATTGDCAAQVVEAAFAELPIDPPDQCIDAAIQQSVARADGEAVLRTDFPLGTSILGSFANYADGRWSPTETPEELIRQPYVARPSRITYQPVADAPSGPWLGALRAAPTGSYGPEPTYRQQRPPANSPFLQYEVVGGFDGVQVAEQFSSQSQWLPENTYLPPSAIARLDKDARPIDPTQLRPTANPLGYLLEPPQALTTLAAAEELIGERPISAIRVRIAGVEEPGQAAWSRIENAARMIRSATGLEALVTLGAAPARVLVHAPGVSAAEQPSGRQAWQLPVDPTGTMPAPPPAAARDVEGFGWVEEPWLVQGASISYLEAGAAQHLWLLGVLAATAVVYLTAAFTSLGLAQIPAIAIRRAVGWSRRRIFLHEMAHAAVFGLLGAVAGVAVGIGIASWFGLRPSPALLAAAAPAAIAVACVAAVLPAWRVSHVPVAAALSGGEVALHPARRRRLGRDAQAILSIAVIELWRLRTRALLALTAGILATGSIVVLTAVRSQFSGSLQVTVLGQAILVETGPLQTAVTGVTVLLAVALLGELLWQGVIDRRRELGVLRAVGWRRRHVAQLMVWQGALLGGCCGLVGVAVTASMLAWLLGDATVSGLVGSALLWSTASGVLLGTAAAGLPAWRAAHEVPAVTLRSP